MKVTELREKLGGDAPVAKMLKHFGADASSSTMQLPFQPAMADSSPSPAPRRQKRTAKQAGLKMHAANVPSGWLETNKQGARLCDGFQTGKCTTLNRGRCAADKNCAHQCAICLDNRHGAAKCDQSKKNDTKPVRRGRRGAK